MGTEVLSEGIESAGADWKVVVFWKDLHCLGKVYKRAVKQSSFAFATLLVKFHARMCKTSPQPFYGLLQVWCL